MLKILENNSPAEFDEKLRTVLTLKATVKSTGQIEFTFKDGREITV